MHIFKYLTCSRNISRIIQISWNQLSHSTYKKNIKFLTVHQQYRNLYLNNICFKILPYYLTEIGEGITQVIIKEWFVKEGDNISKFDNICEVQSEKALVTIVNKYDGIVKKIHYKVNEIALIGKPLIDIDAKEDLMSTILSPLVSTSTLAPYFSSFVEKGIMLFNLFDTAPEIKAGNINLLDGKLAFNLDEKRIVDTKIFLGSDSTVPLQKQKSNPNEKGNKKEEEIIYNTAKNHPVLDVNSLFKTNNYQDWNMNILLAKNSKNSNQDDKSDVHIALNGKTLFGSDMKSGTSKEFPPLYLPMSHTLIKKSPEKENKIISLNLTDIVDINNDVKIIKWFVKQNDRVVKFDKLCKVLTDKESIIITSKVSGIIKKLHYNINEFAVVGTPLVDIEIMKDTYDIENADISVSSHKSTKENQIYLDDIIGSNYRGQYVKRDILYHLNKESPASLPATAARELQTLAAKPNVLNSNINEQEVRPIREFTKNMIKSMTEAMKIPHLVYHDEIKISNLINLQRKLRKRNINFTLFPFFIKAVSNGLFIKPIVNARLDETLSNIVYYKSHNIALAMHTPNGFVTPVIKDVQKRHLMDINEEINKLLDLGKINQLKNQELSDATFTVLNSGRTGGTYTKPVILPPQSAIIALGAFKDIPRYTNKGQLKKETVCYISASADNRIIDNVTIRDFCNRIKEQIEDPDLLLLNV